MGSIIEGPGGVYNQYAGFHETLQDLVYYFAQTSELVLDPELPSYALMLALFEVVPDMLQATTDLRAYSRSGTGRLNAEAKLTLYSRGWQLGNAGRRLDGEATRALQATLAVGQTAKGLAELVETHMPRQAENLQAVEALVNQGALGEDFVPAELEATLQALLGDLILFHRATRESLRDLLNQRIARLEGALFLSFAESGVGLLVGAGVMFWVVASVRRRAQHLDKVLVTLAGGDLRESVPSSLTLASDELGSVARSVSQVHTDLSAQVHALEQTATNLSTIGMSLGTNAEQSAAAIEQMAATTGHVAQNAQGQARQTSHAGQEVGGLLKRIVESSERALSLEKRFVEFELTMQGSLVALRRTAEQSKQTDALAQALLATGQRGSADLEALRASIAEVAAKTGAVQEIVQMILDIADRSSLLSMNAAIEAAHAGTAGRGFAIVAEEIRRLATTSAQQAHTIGNLLATIRAASDQTLDRSQAATASFQSLFGDIQLVRQANQEMSVQVSEQEANGGGLVSGLAEVAVIYRELVESLSLQADGSQKVRESLELLTDSSVEIDHSMQEQRLGMDQASEAVGNVRDITLELKAVIDQVRQILSRFKTG